MLSGMKCFSILHLFLTISRSLLSLSTTPSLYIYDISHYLLSAETIIRCSYHFYSTFSTSIFYSSLLSSTNLLIQLLINNYNTTERLVASVLVVEDLWCARGDAELYSTRVKRLRSTWKKACLITSSTTARISSED